MPYTIHIDHYKQLVIVVGRDPVTVDDALMALDWQIAGRAWSYRTLHDARGVSSAPTRDDVRTIVARADTSARTLGPRGPVAYIAPPEALVEMARTDVHAATAFARQAEVFRDVAAALRWFDGHLP
jgi:hypothetical protein